MTACADIAVVLLAAGAGSRFGGNKLEADLNGALLGSHAARTVSDMGFGWRFAVYGTSGAALMVLLADAGFAAVMNSAPEYGMAQSVALATRAVMATDAQAMLVVLADMPFVTADHVRALLTAHRANQQRIIASMVDDVRTPPALFPRATWPMLMTLSGDRGAGALLRHAIPVIGTAAMLSDIDTPDDLVRANRR